MQDRQPKSIRKPAESVEHVKQGECAQDGQAEPIRKPADSLEHAGLQRLKGELNRLGHVAVTHSIFRTTDKSKTRARTAEAKAKPKAKAKKVPPRQGGHVRAKGELERLRHVPVGHSVFATTETCGTRSKTAKAEGNGPVLARLNEEASTSPEGDEVLSNGHFGLMAERRTPDYQDQSSLEMESDDSMPVIGSDGADGVREVEDGILLEEDDDTIIVKTW